MTAALKWAHEVVPHPGEGESLPLAQLVRYHYAQAIAWHYTFADLVADDTYGAHFDRALYQYLHHAHLAFLHDALAQDLVGQEAADWASGRCHSESAELVWERATRHDLDPAQIRGYELRR